MIIIAFSNNDYNWVLPSSPVEASLKKGDTVKTRIIAAQMNTLTSRITGNSSQGQYRIKQHPRYQKKKWTYTDKLRKTVPSKMNLMLILLLPLLVYLWQICVSMLRYVMSMLHRVRQNMIMGRQWTYMWKKKQLLSVKLIKVGPLRAIPKAEAAPSTQTAEVMEEPTAVIVTSIS